jgi:hypothetical protein
MILHHSPSPAGRVSLRGWARLGGDPLAATLGRRLDDAFHYFRSLAPGSGHPIDVIVVGPGGTWAITAAHLRGRYRKRNGHWYRWNAATDSWIPWDAVPITEARMAGHRLELHLERAGLPAAVEACLLPTGGAEIDWERDQRPGLHIKADQASLARRIARDEVLTPAQVDRIVELLDPRRPVPRLATSSPRG